MTHLVSVLRALCASSVEASQALSIAPAEMRVAFAAVLDGGASDLETGALMAASAMLEARREAGYVEVLLGLLDALQPRTSALPMEMAGAPLVVIPNYGSESSCVAIPLLALLLRRLGVGVLLHGAVETSGGLFTCTVLRDFGVLPAATRGQAERQLRDIGCAVLPTSLFAPGLAAMLALRNRLGMTTPAHTLVPLLSPVRVEQETQPLHVVPLPLWLSTPMSHEAVWPDAPTLLVATTDEGAIAGSRPRLCFRRDPRTSWRMLFEAEAGAGNSLPAGNDPLAWAAWTRLRLEGRAMPPPPVANLLACCLYGCGYAADFNQAKAIAAVEVSGLAA